MARPIRANRDARPVVGIEQLPFDLRRRSRPLENVIQLVLLLCGAVSILTTAGIVLVLIREALLFFSTPAVSLVAFVTDTIWAPQSSRFGIAPLLSATLITSVIAMVVAAPLGLGAAIYLSEYAAPRRRAVLKPILEILAGVPTVVYGFFALTFVTPAILQPLFGKEHVQIYNMASAGLTMGIMILPLMASMSEDALGAVPLAQREGAYGLGATRLETALQVVVPAALSGIIAAFIVSLSRAVGETMIVALAAGAGPNLTLNPFQAAETMTGHIARISGGDISYGDIQYTSIFAIGLALFVMTLLLNIVSGYVVRHFREVYD
jgi:phosphate transport system permease protein